MLISKTTSICLHYLQHLSICKETIIKKACLNVLSGQSHCKQLNEAYQNIGIGVVINWVF